MGPIHSAATRREVLGGKFGWSDDEVRTFEAGLEEGAEYTVFIQNNYNVENFVGKKSIIDRLKAKFNII